MQERYLGDIHDFFKLNFLEYLSKRIGEKVGLNWYLNNPKEIGKNEMTLNDGEIRNFLFKEKYKAQNLRLINELNYLIRKKNRSIRKFTQFSYLSKYINFYNKKITLNNRENWFNNSLIFFKNNNFIFLDPDNGLETESIGPKSRKTVKYIKHSEIQNLSELGKVTIFCQFQSFAKNHEEILKMKINSIKKRINLKGNFPIIRNRSRPNTFFLFIGCTKQIREIKPLLKDYQRKNCLTQLLEF